MRVFTSVLGQRTWQVCDGIQMANRNWRTGVGAAGCVLAAAGGAAAGSGQGVLAAGVLISLGIGGAGVAIYFRDPVRALIWLWIAVVLNAALSVLVGYDSSAGQKVRQADEVLVLLFVALTVWRTLRTNTRIPLRLVLPGLGVALCGLLGAALQVVPLEVVIPGAWLGTEVLDDDRCCRSPSMEGSRRTARI